MDESGTADRLGDKPADGKLRVVHAFVNTRNGSGREDFPNPDALRDWLAGHDLISPRVRLNNADLEQARCVRDALVRLALARQSGQQDTDAIETLNRAAGRAQMAVSFDADGRGRIRPLAPAADGALGAIIAIVFEAMTDGTWNRLKICRDPSCAFAFYDRSKNRSGAWCDIASCGNVAKARTFRARHAHHAHHTRNAS
ncbi:MAG TPA: ABATE domain-containing protein [Candidatus Eremiobacteraceae bacterium]|nr:ABATE domain-containing protein [Candidatus Eremiobacteraceae bacterium]